ncbi:MAG TPA: hypothetical protein PKE41_00860, partial [Candidatus Macondimonas sp.]|nr:hypothetical protein [Candidatus Macondimonas sp.]
MTRTARPSLWPLAIALAAALFLIRTEAELIRLTVALGALFYTGGYIFASSSTPGGRGRREPLDPRDDEEQPRLRDALEPPSLAVTDDRAAGAPHPVAAAPSVTLFVPATASAGLAAAALIVLFATVPFSTLPMTSLWFAWILGLFPLGYLLGMTALARGARPWALLRTAGGLIGAFAIWGIVEWLETGNRSNGP